MPECLRGCATRRTAVVGAAQLVLQLFIGAGMQAQTPAWQLEQGTARFTAGYTFGSFSGSTTSVRGSVRGTSLQGAKGNVEVVLDSISTGNHLRDKHMRAALETSAHPTARFTTDSIRLLVPAVADSALLFGTFTVKGVSRPVRTRARVLEVPPSSSQDRAWIVETSFAVALAEHGIKEGISRFLGTVKVAPIVTVSFSARFAPSQAVPTQSNFTPVVRSQPSATHEVQVRYNR